MSDITEKTLRGGVAKIAVQLIRFLLRMGSLMVLGRLLAPKDFGLVGMVTAVLGALNLIKDFGLSTATIQRESISEEQISTLFWLNIAVGLLLGLIALGLSPVVVAFYHEPSLYAVTAVLATGFVINSAGVQHTALLLRDMRFTTSAVIDIISLILSTGLGVLMAVAGYRYWSLVGMSISALAVSTLGVWIATRWVPGRPHKNVGIRSMLRFGGTITINSIVVYAAYNCEKLLLGRFWGASAIGIYGRAYQLVTLPTDNLNSAVGGIAFSALSRLQGDPERFKRSFLRGYSLILGMTLPITVGCALFADDVIAVVLGPQWKEAAILLRLLAPTILILAMINPLAWLLFSLGLVDRSLKVGLVMAPLVIAGYLCGLSHGPVGVAIGYSTVMVLWAVPHIAWCVHGTVVSFRDIVVALGRPLFAAMIGGAAAFAVSWSCGQSLLPIVRLALSGSVLVAVYVWTLLYVMGQKPMYMKLIHKMAGRTAVAESGLVSV